jgi:phage gp36-like protein
MNRISITNPSLRKYESSELTSDASAGSDVSLSVKNNQGFSVDDLILGSKKGYEKSEVCQIKTITGNTTIVVHTLKLGHTEGTEIRMVPYDKVKLYSSSTETGTYTAVGDWVDIDYDNMMTYIDDSSGDDDTWYKAKFRHSISAVESTLSDAFQVTDAGYYCTISEVLDEAGMIDNRYVDNEFVNRCRRRAQLEVDGSLYGKYELPLSTIPDIVKEITRLLASGWLLFKEYGAESDGTSKDGMAKVKEARGMLKDIREGKVILLDADKAEMTTAGKTYSEAESWPDDTTEDADESGGEIQFRISKKF